ncbi:hypothetical protein NEOLEDRAFT_1161206 [Neolentinus lepideus HHB14362 ss-1]|uniref:Uncharacterized protein n=1 Tax=Neolentinus lepideus HHB14362 ss-1 TaxID=1314782 RepID=A0A165UCY6_9AGAM|nr:hypothetical protein NEOLEDRAFT_1161206 [Neolentinus lepideus HHB14362 ss-1]
MPPHKSSASSASASATKSRKRRITRQDLLNALEILGPLSAPLPPELPSPPASRASSPVRGTKRKQLATAETSNATQLKRPRTSTTATGNQTRVVRTEPTEDGEVGEERTYQVAQPAFTSTFVPVRRPRRGRPQKGDTTWERRQHIIRYWARALKFSAEQRWNSTHPPSDPQYRSLTHPPPTDSSYHKHGATIARLEALDSLFCFAYANWLSEYPKKQANSDSWETLHPYANWCLRLWGNPDTAGERETAFFGLISMLKGFIDSRKYIQQTTEELAVKGATDLERQQKRTKDKLVADELAKDPSLRDLPPKQLPSPASTAHGSANSTPNVLQEGTPARASESTSPSNPRNKPPKREGFSDLGKPLTKDAFELWIKDKMPSDVAASQGIFIPDTTYAYITHVKSQAAHLDESIRHAEAAQTKLNLPVLAKHFPTTFARVIQTSLQPHEEYEPDFDDDEGELYWPGNGVTGEGLGWVCLLGRAMIREFGKDYGYKGYHGIVRRKDWQKDGNLPPYHPIFEMREVPDTW